jgi:hypothetical protein
MHVVHLKERWRRIRLPLVFVVWAACCLAKGFEPAWIFFVCGVLNAWLLSDALFEPLEASDR